MRVLKFIPIVLVVFVLSKSAFTQCVRGDVTTNSLSGVVYWQVKQELRETIDGASIQLLDKKKHSVIEQTKSDSKGEFSFTNIKPGRSYILRAHFESLDVIWIGLNYSTKSKKEVENRVVIGLSFPDFSGTDSCEGGVQIK